MQALKKIRDRIFQIGDADSFNAIALELFQVQYAKNTIYRRFTDMLGVIPTKVDQPSRIPFLPVEFFKNHRVMLNDLKEERIFKSSGTTGSGRSKHYIADIELYIRSFCEGFMRFYGDIRDYCILALLPSYLEQGDSSLVFMVDWFIKHSKYRESGFFLHDHGALANRLLNVSRKEYKVLLFGVSYALFDFADAYPMDLSGAVVMETGGMKGRRKEMTRAELHEKLKKGLNIQNVHSEYGMTELLSQAYSAGDGYFDTPPWMKVFTRDLHDPLEILPAGETGPVNIIDLANIYSCSFIATQDLARLRSDGTFEILGRVDSSDMRGCSLMLA